MRLINADELKNDLKQYFTVGVLDGVSAKLAFNQILHDIDNAPTVEVPEDEVNCVLTMFGKCSYNKTGCSDCEIKDKIRKALNEKPQDKWIPVSERLPERYKEVIVTDIETSGTYQSRYVGNGYWECDNGTLKNRIIAWQPLPEPYQKGGTE